jgi:hypothetical protein
MTFPEHRHNMKGIEIVKPSEPRPEGSRKFQAEECTARLEDANHLPERLLHVGDIPNGETDHDRVEGIVVKGNFLRIALNVNNAPAGPRVGPFFPCRR